MFYLIIFYQKKKKTAPNKMKRFLILFVKENYSSNNKLRVTSTLSRVALENGHIS